MQALDSLRAPVRRRHSGPDGYIDIDVTDSVGDYFEFLGDSLVGDDLASAIENGDDDDDGPDNGLGDDRLEQL
ncbi:hypothetical protein D8Y22_15785 [Salinadaptatus halalkaliphilus]|uniref:Uncharacterized protein n=1 Tax=Salinadaptatus halalkaliphilus TaxID=2419781 RepID=A0A4S3TJQ8_9EURY|nr:hypothetical protein [Salinadaptatus halalkaliphilus]THE63800.1 hypothetical protein D8Y22_15785 [Salinadaptatus halalkaliphilus]